MIAPLPLSFNDIAGAPTEGSLLCMIDDLADHNCVELHYRQGDKLFNGFIVLHRGTIRAYENSCPHTGTPLNLAEGQFFSSDGQELQCRTHDARFNPKNGRCSQGPCIDAWLRQLKIAVVGGRVLAG